MSKQFEEEYKALADREAPDLWARIENGLTPRTTASEGNAVKEEKRVKEGDSKEKDIQKRGVFMFLHRYGSIAAAVICMVILLPAILLVNRMGSSKNTLEDSAAAGGRPAGMAEMAEETEEEVCEAFVIEEAPAAKELEGAMEAAVVEAAGEAADMADMASAAEASAEEASEEMADAVNGVDSGAVKKEAKIEMSAARSIDAEAAVLEDITVKVVKNLEISLAEIGTVYTIEIIKDPSGSLASNMQADVLLPKSFSASLQEGRVYRITLQKEDENEHFAYKILSCLAEAEP